MMNPTGRRVPNCREREKEKEFFFFKKKREERGDCCCCCCFAIGVSFPVATTSWTTAVATVLLPSFRVHPLKLFVYLYFVLLVSLGLWVRWVGGCSG